MIGRLKYDVVIGGGRVLMLNGCPFRMPIDPCGHLNWVLEFECIHLAVFNQLNATLCSCATDSHHLDHLVCTPCSTSSVGSMRRNPLE